VIKVLFFAYFVVYCDYWPFVMRRVMIGFFTVISK